MSNILKIIDDEDFKISFVINGVMASNYNFSIEKIVIENINFYEFCVKNYV